MGQEKVNDLDYANFKIKSLERQLEVTIAVKDAYKNKLRTILFEEKEADPSAAEDMENDLPLSQNINKRNVSASDYDVDEELDLSLSKRKP